jgi:hypothetical protein
MNRSRTIVNKLNNKQPIAGDGGSDGDVFLDIDYASQVSGERARPFVAVSCAMILIAVRDMRERRPEYIQSRISSVVWMVSSAATPWFDASGVDQQYALNGMDWVGHAQQVLEMHSGELSDEQSELLRGGLGYLGEHPPPKAV